MHKRLLFLILFVLAGCDGVDPPENLATEVTLLVVYTPDAAAAAVDIDAAIAAAVAETNVVFANSRVDVALTVVGAREIEYTTTERLQDLAYLVGREDGVLDEVHTLRDEVEADLVALFTNDPASTINAAVMATPATAFVAIYWRQAGATGYALAHELGHLFGARHTPDSDPLALPLPYGHGFRNETYRTIMANGPQTRVPYFSGPDQVYLGVVLGDSALSDVARLLRETAVYVSNFRGSQTETAFVPPGTWPIVNP
ncbi:MAG: M12 family metallo-peptidase [Rhodothermales bacterium]|nr:M12 family metallo-peptidase [Rhodothermales bacterium]